LDVPVAFLNCQAALFQFTEQDFIGTGTVCWCIEGG